MIKWKAMTGNTEPMSVEVTRESEKSVWLSGGEEYRTPKQLPYKCYFDTEDEAWDWLESKERGRVERAREALKYHAKNLQAIIANRDKA